VTGPTATRLRPTGADDLDLVIRLETDADNSRWVGSWTRAQHLAAIEAPDREHWVIEAAAAPVGYAITFDLRDAGRGVHIKRIVVDAKGRGIGRVAVAQLARRAFDELGAEFIWLDVMADNHRAQTAYRAAGFEARSFTDEEAAAWATSVECEEVGSVLMFCPAPTER